MQPESRLSSGERSWGQHYCHVRRVSLAWRGASYVQCMSPDGAVFLFVDGDGRGNVGGVGVRAQVNGTAMTQVDSA